MKTRVRCSYEPSDFVTVVPVADNISDQIILGMTYEKEERRVLLTPKKARRLAKALKRAAKEARR